MTNPNVILSDHTLERCRQRKIDPATLRRAVAKIPPFSGLLEWTFPGKITAVVSNKNGTRVVITVYRPEQPRRKREKV